MQVMKLDFIFSIKENSSILIDLENLREHLESMYNLLRPDDRPTLVKKKEISNQSILTFDFNE